MASEAGAHQRILRGLVHRIPNRATSGSNYHYSHFTDEGAEGQPTRGHLAGEGWCPDVPSDSPMSAVSLDFALL